MRLLSLVGLVSRAKAAIATGRPWTFTDRHSDLAHALFHDDLADLGEVQWQVMAEKYWQKVKEERQVERAEAVVDEARAHPGRVGAAEKVGREADVS